MEVLPVLSPFYHCLTPDLLGFGESEPPQGRCSVSMQVESLAEFLTFLRVKNCILIGHSIGAWIAATYALRYPNQISGLVLLAPEGVKTPALARRWRGCRVLASPIPLVGWALRLLYSIAKLLSNGQALQTAIRHRRYLKSAPVACQLLFQRRRAELEADDLGDRLSHLSCPLRLIQGDRDDATAIALTRAYAEAASVSITSVPSHTGMMEPWLLPSRVKCFTPDTNSASPDSEAVNPAFVSTLQGEPIHNTALRAMLQSSQTSPTNVYSPTDETLNGAIANAIKDFIEQHSL